MDDAQEKIRYFESLKRNNVNFITTIERAAGKNPEIDQKVFETIIKINNELHKDLAKELHATYEHSSRDLLAHNLNSVKAKYASILRDRVLAVHPEQGDAALAAITKEMQPKGIFSSITNYIYNDEGFQFGGIIGGLALGFAGYKMTAEAGMLTNVLGTIALGMAGAYFAHKYIDPKPQPVIIPDLHSRGRTNQVAMGRAREKAGETPVAEPAAAEYGEILARANAKPPEVKDSDVRSMMIKGDLAKSTGDISLT